MNFTRLLLFVLLLGQLTAIFPAAWGQTVGVLFSDVVGRAPRAGLVKGNDGSFYGTTFYGGASDFGTIFKISPDGELTTLLSFAGANGANPRAALIQGSDGNFYGTTYSGGISGQGTVFKMTPSGVLTTLFAFKFNDVDGNQPMAPLMEGSDGSFYGTTSMGGINSGGTIFKITSTGTLTTLVSLTMAQGRFPEAGMVEGTDGKLYGTTPTGGVHNNGTVFKITPEGVHTVLVSFNQTDGMRPFGALVRGSDGDLYGTTTEGGANGKGTVFKMTPAGVLTTLASFNGANGRSPYSALVEGSDGSFYGATGIGGASDCGTVYKITPAGVLTTITSFNSTNGRNPGAGVIEGSNGTFFGVTESNGPNGNGAVFKVTASGELTTLALFNYHNGAYPLGGLVEGGDGHFYGTTSLGGANDHGTVFKVAPDGTLTTLVSFESATNGKTPRGKLLKGSDGVFYGTTQWGGTKNYGTVFKMTSDGKLTTLVTFDSTNGRYPSAGLVEGGDGNLYGTTSNGGGNGKGTVFKMTPGGELTTLVTFIGSNGSHPSAELVVGSDGNFYGTTWGASGVRSTVFKMTPGGELTTLVHLSRDEGLNPGTALVEGSDGSFYGTTSLGGSNHFGAIFKVTPGGELTTLVSFTGSNGRSPHGELVQRADGYFYGTTSHGGTDDKGTVFRMTPAGQLTTLASFADSPVFAPNGPLVFGANGKLYGMAEQMAVWHLALAPLVMAFEPSAITATSADVSGTIVAYESDTTVSVQYGLTPEYGNTVAAIPGTIAGTSATAVGATLTGLFPHTSYYYRLTATNANGATHSAGGTFITANTLPVAANDLFSSGATPLGAFSIDVLGNDSDADGDPLTISAVTQGSFGMLTTNGLKLTYTPGPGFFGRDIFSYTMSDGIATATAQVELRATAPFMRTLFVKGSEVPGAGQEGSEITAGSLFASFGVPAINSSGNLALTASYAVSGSADELSVLVLDPQVQGSRLAALRGHPAPGTVGALFASFNDPLLNEAGDVAFLASLSGGDAKKSSKQGIWINAASAAGSSGTQMLARTGAQAAGAPVGATWKSFTSLAFSSRVADPEATATEDIWTLAFTGFMTTGSGGVKANNDMGLWIASPGRTVLALRERQKLEVEGAEKQVRTFAALRSLPGAPAQGGGVTNEGGVAVQVFFTDGSQAMLRVSDDPAGENIAIDVLALPGDAVAEVSETAAKFGIPSQSDSGTATAWVGGLSGKGKPAAIFERDLNDSELLHLMARKGGAAPGIDGATFSAFTNVAVNDSGSALFLGKVRGSGISKTNDEGLWWRKSEGETTLLQLLARGGSQPPGLDGVKWHSFSSVALPEGRHGPLFTAKLKSASLGHMGQGLWTVDSSGEPQLIVREGMNVPTENSNANASIQRFTVLSAAPGSPTQRRSYNDAGRIVLHVVFDGAASAEGIITVQLP